MEKRGKKGGSYACHKNCFLQFCGVVTHPLPMLYHSASHPPFFYLYHFLLLYTLRPTNMEPSFFGFYTTTIKLSTAYWCNLILLKKSLSFLLSLSSKWELIMDMVFNALLPAFLEIASALLQIVD